MRRLCLIAALAAMIGVSADLANAALIYRQLFNGNGAPLHNTAPTVDNNLGGAARWVARTNDGTQAGTGIVFYNNGNIVGTEAAAPTTFGNATLPFVPAAGTKYLLDVRLGGVTVPDASANWVGVGFAQGSTTTGGANGDRFIGPGGSAGQPWMLYRGTGAPAAQIDQTFTGAGTTGGMNWPSQVVATRGAAVDLRIALDTRTALWKADWFAKRPTDAGFTLLRSESYATNPTIGAVGYAIANNNVTGTILSLELQTVPEPSTVIMLLAGFAIGVLRFRRAT